jgi:hypothetical protein
MEEIYIEKDISNMLMPGERVLYATQQSRIMPGGSVTTPNKLYVSNFRVIFRDPSMLGLKKIINDYHFKDISNIRMKKGVFTTEIYLKSRFLSDEVVLPAVSHGEAEIISKYIRNGIHGNIPSQDLDNNSTGQIYTEKIVNNSFRSLNSNKNSSINLDSSINNSIDPIIKLEKLNQLRISGALSEEEFNNLKIGILSNLNKNNENKDSFPKNNSETETKSNTPKYCNECGGNLDFIKEGPYQGEFVRLYRCTSCNKLHMKRGLI